jgi:lysophospholipase
MSNKNKLQKRFTEPANWQWGSLTNARGTDLRYGFLREHEKPLANLIYVEGLSEFSEKTFELARDFNKHACNFYVFDRQGQGLSGRNLNNEFKQHSTGFEHDIQDLVHFAKTVIPKGEPIVLVGHSAGGMIALAAQHDHPELFKATILSAPLLGIDNPIVKNKEEFFAKLDLPEIIKQSYVPGGGGWKPRSHISSALKEADFSSDPIRNKIQDQWEHINPKLRTGSATFGWVLSACKLITKIRKPDYLKEISRPVLAFTVGKDKLVNNEHTFEAVKHIPDCEHVHFENAKHEPFMETDDVRKPMIKKSVSFLKKSI